MALLNNAEIQDRIKIAQYMAGKLKKSKSKAQVIALAISHTTSILFGWCNLSLILPAIIEKTMEGI